MTDQQAQGRVPHHAADGTLKHYCSEGYCPDITDRQERRKDAEARTSFVAVVDQQAQPLTDYERLNRVDPLSDEELEHIRRCWDEIRYTYSGGRPQKLVHRLLATIDALRLRCAELEAALHPEAPEYVAIRRAELDALRLTLEEIRKIISETPEDTANREYAYGRIKAAAKAEGDHGGEAAK